MVVFGIIADGRVVWGSDEPITGQVRSYTTSVDMSAYLVTCIPV